MTAAVFGNFSQTAEDTFRIHTGILEKLRASPGVVAAAMTNSVPQSSIRPGRRSDRARGAARNGSARRSTSIRTSPVRATSRRLACRMLSGRSLRDSDSLDPTPVAVINQSMAQFWNGADPVGRRFALDTGRNAHVDHGRRRRRRLPALRRGHARFEAQYYVPYSRRTAFGGRMLVRTDGPPVGARQDDSKPAVQTTNAQTPVEELQTLDELRNGRLAVPGLTAALLSIFAAIALVITVAGLAGLIGTSVSQRTREFGLRMALGASRGSVLKLVLSPRRRARGHRPRARDRRRLRVQPAHHRIPVRDDGDQPHGVRRHCACCSSSPPSSPHSAQRVGRRRWIH